MNLFDADYDFNQQDMVPDGIRLHKMEVYNWGTFHNQIWSFTPQGETSLLTGDAGSGKSTLVDGLSTLLVSPQKASYNKAADATSRERSSKTYVLGYYGKKYAYEGKGTPEMLRKQGETYSVLLATFVDLYQETTTTLAIFFYFKDSDTSPSRLYVVADQELSIQRDFTRFGAGTKVLKERLKARGAQIFEGYPPYAAAYRKRMGNLGEGAIDLFQQTISMKKVEALGEFVRSSMLEQEDMEGHILELLAHYRNLDLAHKAVEKARAQIQQLSPIAQMGNRFDEVNEERMKLEFARNSLSAWVATQKRGLVQEKQGQTRQMIEELTQREGLLQEEYDGCQNQLNQVRLAIDRQGGEEIRRLEGEIILGEKELSRRSQSLVQYSTFAQTVDLPKATSLTLFVENRGRLQGLTQETQGQREENQRALTQLEVGLDVAKKEQDSLKEDIASLQGRSSNLPRYLEELRQRLCQGVGLSKGALPFAGELLEVRPEEGAWEGAIERLVNPFARSILVQESHYSAVSQWVNAQHLGARLVYYRIGTPRGEQQLYGDGTHTVASKLSIKSDSPFAPWLAGEIVSRYPHLCCENMEAFQRQSQAITKAGQIKSKSRHEKDDRSDVGDRRNYVLGFSNQRKLKLFLQQYSTRQKEMQGITQEIERARMRQDWITTRLQALTRLTEITDFSTLDIATTQRELEGHRRRKAALEQGDKVMQTLRQTQEEFEGRLKRVQKQMSDNATRLGGEKKERDHLEVLSKSIQETLRLETREDRGRYPLLAQLAQEAIPSLQWTLEKSDGLERRLSGWLSHRVDGLRNELDGLKENLVRAMGQFCRNYPEDTMELKDDVSYRMDFRRRLEELEYDNLPQYQQAFQQELHGKIIQHISLFHSILNQASQQVERKIVQINQSLYCIDYNPGRYIEIKGDPTPDMDIRNFRAQLKACTTQATSGLGDPAFAQEKFEQIKSILACFKGREGQTEQDKRWTQKVTDVRNWFVFSACERWRDSGAEYEFYADSDGKSGGQKEKLAYTILAASLSNHYHLHQRGNNGSSFRLVVIDEAFLKGSDKSAVFGLELFKKLEFQLLVVTPLLKIATIEPYIAHVGFVAHDEESHCSSIQNISVEVMRERRQEREVSHGKTLVHT